ncbi:MAG: hypothetical protein HRU20_21290 [Pseudomonadales bacterium]|nr:hypothetical protein [Pseudomonadales bacterium]
MTYIATREGLFYLSIFIDICSGTVVGWSIGSRMRAHLVTDSLGMEISSRRQKIRFNSA